MLKSSKILVLPDKKIVEASHQASLLEALLEAKLEIEHSCGGNGTCGTCRVFVESGEASSRSEIELEMATERSFADNERLSCQAVPCGPLSIRIANAGT